ncbi:Cas10/Cmr2 second palm domain-containing protein [Helicobacter sp. MIT 01-3238]|uniref:Cas10/Cmr2 second palm domain-containing protein n=1 Tax=Helicobacter sp. MIT 01-3238 TaxID=398627 RepID=UPI000E1EE3B6|nr:hypothetical protein [Helicobacter sp. MIT 01-3238]RDU54285.1 hypothetical protein CQA40_03620 [Helicobacter sp. MIT 01-3238]
MAFLYGFSAVGLQDFIFRTNVLQEIIGASEIIKSIDDLGKDLQDFFGKNDISLNKNPEIILASAGNLRAIFDDEADLQKVVLHLHKLIAMKSYGLGISQAVVKYDGDYASATSLLESKLKIARNKLDFPLDFSHCILKHNPKTAFPQSPNTQSDDKYRKIDKSTFQKLQAFDNFDESNPNSINELSKLKNAKNKIALIYADGNALGNIVRALSKDEMKSFSTTLDNATKESFAKSSTQIKDKYGEIKIREVICGGDDLVVVCNADIALDFAKAFLEHFENLTQNIHKNQNLTACAAIAFFNHKYPIHYALKLAKDLCKEAKIRSKALDSTNPPSSLMFHNIQSSAVQSFSAFIDDELSLGKNQGKEHIVRLDFGAYFLHNQSRATIPTIEHLLSLVQIFRETDAPTSRLRQWLSMLDSSKNLAYNELKQIAKIYDAFATKHDSAFKNLHKDLSLSNLIIQKDGFSKTPIYDIISLISNTAQTSKIKKGDLDE